MTGEWTDHLPVIVPALSDDEVARFAALGDRADALLREGDEDGARAACLAQVAIFPGNPEPHVSLALLAARRNDAPGAIRHLRDAVVRGFQEMERVDRAEAWIRLRRSTEFEKLCWAVPLLAEEERRRTAWAEAPKLPAPTDVRTVLARHGEAMGRIERMAPALGPRLVRLWTRRLEQGAAAHLEAYVASRPDAPDLEAALVRLMSLYAGGGALEWQVLPPEPARLLQTVARTALSRFPDSPARPGALACRALAANAVRDREGRLDPRAVPEAAADLEALLAAGPDGPHAALAAAGLVQLEIDLGRWDRARARFAALDPAGQAAVRQHLGGAALRLGGLPEFAATALDGTSLDRAALGGRVAVLDFWATWCAPCVEEFPTLRRIAERHGERVRLVGVNLDAGEEITPEALRAWVAEESLPGHHLHDGRSWDSPLVAAFGVREIPFTVVVAADGEIVAVGAHGKELEKAVSAALKGESR